MSDNALSGLFLPFIEQQGGINKACKYIAKRLKGKWTWKYLYHVYRGKVQPGQELIRKLKALQPPNPSRPRHRKIIEATSEEQLKQWNTLNADELRQALDKEAKRKHGKQTKTQPKTMQK